MTQKDITIYSTPTCPFCKKAKAFLDEQGLTYKDIDVSANQEQAEKMINISGQMGVPVLVIGGEIIVGFDKKKVEAML